MPIKYEFVAVLGLNSGDPAEQANTLPLSHKASHSLYKAEMRSNDHGNEMKPGTVL